MPLVIEHNTREFKPVPAGAHIAVCTMIVNMGVQDDSMFAPRAKLYLRFEIPGELTSWVDRQGNEHTGPATIGKFYTKSLAPKANLRRDLEIWRGRSFSESALRRFDVSVFLGMACQLSVIHKEGRANIASITAPPRGADPKPAGHLVLFDADAAEWDEEAFAALPRWLQQRIADRIRTAPAQKVEPPADAAAAGGQEFEEDPSIPF